MILKTRSAGNRLIGAASTYLRFRHRHADSWEVTEGLIILTVLVLLRTGLETAAHGVSLAVEIVVLLLGMTKFASVGARWYHSRFGSPPF